MISIHVNRLNAKGAKFTLLFQLFGLNIDSLALTKIYLRFVAVAALRFGLAALFAATLVTVFFATVDFLTTVFFAGTLGRLMVTFLAAIGFFDAAEVFAGTAFLALATVFDAGFFAAGFRAAGAGFFAATLFALTALDLAGVGFLSAILRWCSLIGMLKKRAIRRA